jgi:DNA-binding beta-propeller fold protein YncE
MMAVAKPARSASAGWKESFSMTRPLNLLPCAVTFLLGAARVAAAPVVTNSVAIGPQPLSVVVEAGTHQVFVADADLGAVVQYDGSSGTIVGSINIDGQPASLALDDRGHRLFVGNRDTVGPAVSVVDTDSGEVQPLVPAGPRVWGLAFDETLNHLYLGDPDTGDLIIVDGSSGQNVGRVPLGGTPVAIAINPSNGEVGVAVQGRAPALAVLDPSSQAMNALPVPLQEGQPMQVAVDSVTGKFFVARSGANPALLVLRPASSTFDNAIPVAPGVTGIAIDRNSQIYLSHATGTATVIDGTSGNPVAEVPIGGAPNAAGAAPNHAAVDPDSTPTRVYMVDTASGTLSILTNQ